jgi:hypothetical protein
MSLVFGIIDLNETAVPEHEFKTLAQAVCAGESCIVSCTETHMMVGYGHHLKRKRGAAYQKIHRI